MNDERFLKDWLRDTTDSTSDPNAVADKVVARLPETSQRRRWLPWPPARRTKIDEHHGRTRLMISPTQAIAAGALALAIGGAALVAAPLGDTTAPVPGAEAVGSGENTAFDGFISYGTGSQVATRERRDDGVVSMRDQVWTFRDAETSDPRFGGTIRSIWNWDEYDGTDGYEVWTGGWDVQNDGGGWRERPTTTFGFPNGTFPVEMSVFDGTDGYGGLTAIVEIAEVPDDRGFYLRGVIIDGPPPSVPKLLQENATE